MALVRRRFEELGWPSVVLSQRMFEHARFAYEIAGGRVTGRVHVDGAGHALQDFGGLYTRLMDHHGLPEVAGEPAESPRRRRAAHWHEVVSSWSEIAPIRVVNRTSAMASNASKPLQAQAILRRGFLIPETLVTSDPALARDFAARHGRIVFKSMSGVRSIVRQLAAGDLQRLDRIRWCPVQFQAFVDGVNVRVHTVGGEVFATAIATEAVDYRYAQRQCGEPAELRAVELSDEIAERCLALARDLDLPVAGIDLKVTPDDRVYCFEVNPSPAYSYYESETGQPISLALARYLAG